MRAALPLFLLGGVVVGAASAAAWRAPGPAEPEPVVASVTEPGAGPARPCATLSELHQRERTATLRRDATRARIATLEQERTAIAGEPVDWTDDLPAALGPDQVPARFRQAAAEAGLTVHDVECEEPPCVAVVSFTIAEGESFNARRDDALGALEAALDDLVYGGTSSVRQNEDGDMEYYIGGPIWTDDWWTEFADDRDRVSFRFNAALRMTLDEQTSHDRE
jgi:hypothetical protein